MFESSHMLAITRYGQKTCEVLDEGYFKCWQGLQKHFTGENMVESDPAFYKNLGPVPEAHPFSASQ